MSTKRINITISDELDQKLHSVSQRTGKSFSALLRDGFLDNEPESMDKFVDRYTDFVLDRLLDALTVAGYYLVDDDVNTLRELLTKGMKPWLTNKMQELHQSQQAAMADLSVFWKFSNGGSAWQRVLNMVGEDEHLYTLAKRAMYWTLLNDHRFRYGSDEDNDRGWFNWLVDEIDTKLTLHMVQMPQLPLSDEETTRFWHALTELIAFHLAKGLSRGQSLSWAIDQLINDMYFNELLENTIPQFLDMFEGESVYDALTSLNHETVSFCERQGLAFKETKSMTTDELVGRLNDLASLCSEKAKAKDNDVTELVPEMLFDRLNQQFTWLRENRDLHLHGDTFRFLVLYILKGCSNKRINDYLLKRTSLFDLLHSMAVNLKDIQSEFKDGGLERWYNGENVNHTYNDFLSSNEYFEDYDWETVQADMKLLMVELLKLSLDN